MVNRKPHTIADIADADIVRLTNARIIIIIIIVTDKVVIVNVLIISDLR